MPESELTMNFDTILTGHGYTAWLDSTAGAICRRLRFEAPGLDAELLRTPRCEDDLAQNPCLYGNPILFPPNRVRGGCFTFDGRTYRLPVNEPATGSHLHGTLREKPFRMTEQTQDTASFTYCAEADEYPGFPHAFTVTRRYALTPTGLRERTEVTNRSSLPMPVMLGYHTTFCLPVTQDSAAGDYHLTLPVGQMHVRDAHYLPTCAYEDGELNRQLRAGDFVPGLNTVSAFFAATGPEMRLRDVRRGLTVVYRTEGFRYWMLYNGGSAEFVCVEPQTCAIDAFHLDKTPEEAGVISLGAGESVAFSTEIGLERDRPSAD